MITSIFLIFSPFIRSMISIAAITTGYLEPFEDFSPINGDQGDAYSNRDFHTVSHGEVKRTEFFSFHETAGSDVEKLDWKIEICESEILVHKMGSHERATAQYSSDWALHEFIFEGSEQQFEMKMGNERQIAVKKSKNGKEKIVHLERDYPWIQQPTIGLRNFILNKGQKSLHFYMLRPDNFEPVEIIATKVDENEQQTAVEIRADNFLINLAFQADTWHDSKSGLATKMVERRTEGYSLPKTTVTELIQNPAEITLSPI